MRNQKKALVAGIAGLAILAATGGTFAMWYAEGSLSTDTVETGYLRLSEDVVWEEGTVDRDGGQLDVWVPGDWALGVIENGIELRGDNMIADFVVEAAASVSTGDDVQPIQVWMEIGGEWRHVNESATYTWEGITEADSGDIRIAIGFPTFIDGWHATSSWPAELTVSAASETEPGALWWAQDWMDYTSETLELESVSMTLLQRTHNN